MTCVAQKRLCLNSLQKIIIVSHANKVIVGVVVVVVVAVATRVKH